MFKRDQQNKVLPFFVSVFRQILPPDPIHEKTSHWQQCWGEKRHWHAKVHPQPGLSFLSTTQRTKTSCCYCSKCI